MLGNCSTVSEDIPTNSPKFRQIRPQVAGIGAQIGV
jgi:hypothetical protein